MSSLYAMVACLKASRHQLQESACPGVSVLAWLIIGHYVSCSPWHTPNPFCSIIIIAIAHHYVSQYSMNFSSSAREPQVQKNPLLILATLHMTRLATSPLPSQINAGTMVRHVVCCQVVLQPQWPNCYPDSWLLLKVS